MLKRFDTTAIQLGVGSLLGLGYLSIKKLAGKSTSFECLAHVPKLNSSVLAESVAKYHSLGQPQAFSLLCNQANEFLHLIDDTSVKGRHWMANRLISDMERCTTEMCSAAQEAGPHATDAVELALDNTLLTIADTLLHNDLLF